MNQLLPAALLLVLLGAAGYWLFLARQVALDCNRERNQCRITETVFFIPFPRTLALTDIQSAETTMRDTLNKVYTGRAQYYWQRHYFFSVLLHTRQGTVQLTDPRLEKHGCDQVRMGNVINEFLQNPRHPPLSVVDTGSPFFFSLGSASLTAALLLLIGLTRSSSSRAD